jgi:hypothetical protein
MAGVLIGASTLDLRKLEIFGFFGFSYARGKTSENITPGTI